jgi:GT2 family glycosyltransferase
MKISIIILSFNNYEETTGKCLQALSEDLSFGQWEVIVVDNASDENTKRYLFEAKEKYSNVKFIFNSANLGFSGGNNVGIQQSTGDVLILLNSDAFPSPGMLGKLATHLNYEKSFGMMGPVTNAAGNEQCIFTKSGKVEEVNQEGLSYALSGACEILPAYRLDFFCVAISRDALSKVGLLDEEFGRGYYEDFDYSLRMKAAGFKLGIAEDVFVYHRGSTSFEKMPKETKLLLKRNKKRVIQKHGRDVLFQHVRQANLSVLSQYLKRKLNGARIPGHRVSNRLQRAHTGLPKSWFKRWRYLRSVSRVEKRLLDLENI